MKVKKSPNGRQKDPSRLTIARTRGALYLRPNRSCTTMKNIGVLFHHQETICPRTARLAETGTTIKRSLELFMELAKHARSRSLRHQTPESVTTSTLGNGNSRHVAYGAGIAMVVQGCKRNVTLDTQVRCKNCGALPSLMQEPQPRYNSQLHQM